MKRIARNIILGLVGFILLLLVIVQLALTPTVLGRIAQRIIPSFTDGTATFSSIRASVIRSFPNLNVSIEDFALTYPHERFAAYDSLYRDEPATRRFSYARAGRGEDTDTLASFRNLSLSLNYTGILRGDWAVPSASLSRPRIFLHRYDSTAANWDILTFLSDEDTTSSSLPPVTVHRIRLEDRPMVIFTSPSDTVYGLLTMKRVRFDGRLQTVDPDRSVIGLGIDTLFVSGRLPSDTLSLALDRIALEAQDRAVTFDASAKAFLATHGYGRMVVPIRAEGETAFPVRDDGGFGVDVGRLRLDVASLVVDASGNAVLYGDSTRLDARAQVRDCPLGKLVETYSPNFPFLKKYHTDALLSMDAEASGWYRPASGILPAAKARIRIPESAMDYEGFSRKGRVSLALEAVSDSLKKVDVKVDTLLADIPGLQLHLSGTAKDMLGDDPALTVDSRLKARVDTLTGLLTRESGITGTGRIDATLKGKGRFSHLDMKRIAGSELDGRIDMRDLRLKDRKDSLSAMVPKAVLTVKTMANQLDKNLKKTDRVIGVTADLDSLDLTYKKDMYVRGSGLQLLTQTAASVLNQKKGTLPPLLGTLSGKTVSLRDGDDLSVRIGDTKNQFRITPPTTSTGNPTLSLHSTFARIGMREEVHRFAASTASLDVSARKYTAGRTTARSPRMEKLLDSLQTRYPDVPRDSLLRRARRGRALPEWMSEAEFLKSDIHFSLGETVTNLLREWNVNGSLAIGKGFVMTPAWPVRNLITGLKGNFTNDKVEIKEVKIESGASDISGSATLSGLRGALSRRGIFRLNADLSSGTLDVNEVLRVAAHEQTSSAAVSEKDEALSDEQYRKKLENTQLPDSVETKLIVLPGNVDASVKLRAKKILYDSLRVSKARTLLQLKERCLRITETEAFTNVGYIFFDGFYSTRTKKDLKAGFDLALSNVPADKVIEMLPAVDTILPLLKNFNGKLDCQLTATSQLDEEMSLVLPTLDGVLRISGEELTLKNNRQFTQLAKLLRFDNTRAAEVDTMSVSGIIRDNRLEVFPFVVRMDRYTLAMSGLQHFDESFQYHVSVIRSPLPIKFGIDISGPDFNKMRFKVRSPKYRNVNVPVFTKEMDEVRLNLLQSIRNIYEIGVEKAIRNNTGQDIVFDKMRKENFSNTEQGEELGEEEKKELAKALKEKDVSDE